MIRKLSIGLALVLAVVMVVPAFAQETSSAKAASQPMRLARRLGKVAV